MIPFNSNKTGGCDNTSSNCVIWQGPDLPCVDICHGDTISDVIAKLCEELTALSKLAGGSGTHSKFAAINQEGLENGNGQQARHANNETELQNLIIENVVQARVANQSEFGQGDVLTTPVSLPSMLQYQDPNTATIVRALPLQQYATLLGTRISETTSEISILQGQVANHEGRIVSLENTEKRNKTNKSEKQILTTCVGTPGRLTNMSTALIAVERAFCGLQEGTGPQSSLATSIGYQAASLASSKKLNGVGDMSTYNGFILNPNSLAQSFTNAWITINDMRQALESLIADVVPTACKDIIYGFSANVQGDPGQINSLNINFSSSTIPTTFYDCDRSNGSKVIITDDEGSNQVHYASIHQLQNNSAGQTYTLNGLNGSSATFEVEVQFCFTNGVGMECANTQTKTITSTDICPQLTMGTPGLTSISWTVNAQYLPATMNAQIQLLNAAGSVITSQVNSNPGSTWTGSFTNLTPGSAYLIQISYGIPIAGTDNFNHVCPQQSFNTTGTTCTDLEVLAADYKAVATELQYGVAGSFTPIACDDSINPGTNMGDIYIGGFTTSDSSVAGVLRNNTIWAESLTPCSAGKITMNGVSLDYNNPVKSLVTNGVTKARLDVNTNTLGDGWRYIDGITSNGGKNLFVYAEGNTTATTVPIIPQTYFSCVGDEVNISQAAWTTWVPRADAQYAFSANYNYQIAHGNSVQASALSYNVGVASFGVTSFTPNAIPAETQQFTYAPLQSGAFNNTDSNSAALTIGAKTSNYTTSLSRGFWPQSLATDLVVFIDTDAYTETEGLNIKNAMIAAHTSIQTTYSGYTGQLYILPITNCDMVGVGLGSASAYLSNHKIIAMRGAGLSLTSTGTWSTIAQTWTPSTTPVGWWTGTVANLASNMMLFSFIDQADTVTCEGTPYPLYTTALAATAPNAPTTRYLADYDDIMNILVDNNRNTIANGGVGESAWSTANSLNTTYTNLENAIYRCDGHYVIPKQTGLHAGVDGQDKALIRQMILACNAPAGNTTPALIGSQYNAYRFGSDYLNVEAVANWEANLVTNANPYNGTVATVNLNNLAPLSDLNITVVPYIDDYFGYKYTSFVNEMGKLLCLPSVTGASANPTAGGVLEMGVAVHGAGTTYGHSNEATATNTSTQACTNSASVSAVIYSTTGIEFDGTVRAYYTTKGSIDQDFRDELFHDRWYARATGTTGLNVAQYSRTYPHWKNATTCA